RCHRWASRLFAASLFLEKLQMPQKYGRNGPNRPFGPDGQPMYQHCSATCGLSRLATAQALGGFMIKAPLPEMSQRLLEASSQANTSAGRNGTSFLNHSRTCLVASDLTVMLPLASMSCAP